MKNVLLIGWDAADWKVIQPLMDKGHMPALERMVNAGSMASITTLHPVLSPMLWTSIATGKRPFKHGIHGFSEPTPNGQAIRPITNLSRKCKAVWNILNQEGLRSNVVGWWPSHPAEPINGVMVSNQYQRAPKAPVEDGWPMQPGTVHPARLTRELADLRFHPMDLDENVLRPFIPKLELVDQETDGRLQGLARTLADTVTIHSAATWLIDNEPWDFMAVYYDGIDHFSHLAMKYHPPRQEHISEKDFELYHNVITAAYRFHDMMLHALLNRVDDDTVVILMSDHGFHPDHLRPRELPDEPAGPAMEHRDLGIFVIKGPGIKADELLHGPSLLDITPTVLTLFGLPVGDDMDGRPIVDAFEEPPPVRKIPSWEDVDGDSGQHPPDMQLDAHESQEAINQLVALGYIEEPDENIEKAIANTVRELQYNLARSYMDADRYTEAAEILQDLYETWPEEDRFGLQLALCYRALELISELRTLVDTIGTRRRHASAEAMPRLKQLMTTLKERASEQAKGDDRTPVDAATEASVRGHGSEIPSSPETTAENSDEEIPAKKLGEVMTDEERREYRQLRSRAQFKPYQLSYLTGYVCLVEGKAEEALEHFRKAERPHAPRPGLLLQIGDAYLQLKQSEDAERTYQAAMEIDAHSPHAHLGLARTYLQLRNSHRAAEHARRCISLEYQYPMAHYCLGIALQRMRKVNEAVQSLETAVSINPNFPEAYARLNHIYRNLLHDEEKADEFLHLEREAKFAQREHLAEIRQKFHAPVAEPFDVESIEEIHVHKPDLPDEDRELFQRSGARAKGVGIPDGRLTVVSGLPRSGTSMMMQMLEAGGANILTDGERAADEDNPGGYYEFTAAKRLSKDTSWLPEAVGRTVKIIAHLLPRLPPQYQCDIIFMERDLDEVLTSQQTMLGRLGKQGADLAPDKLRSVFAQQLQQIRTWVRSQTNLRLISVPYRHAIESPLETAAQVNEFLGGGLNTEEMAKAVMSELYRNRQLSESDALI